MLTTCQWVYIPGLGDVGDIETCPNPAPFLDCEGPKCEEHRCRRHAPRPNPGIPQPPDEVMQWRRAVPAYLDTVTP